MAEFLSKENINVSSGSQSTFNMNAGSLAQDLQTLMGSVNAIGKDIVKTQLAESERIGSILARDKLIELNGMQSSIKEAIINDPLGFQYGGVRDSVDSIIATDLAKAKEKLGDDSPAYRKFESVYLLQATEMGTRIKDDMNVKEKQTSNFVLKTTTEEQINKNPELFSGSEYTDGIYDSASAGLTINGERVMSDEKISGDIISAVQGKMSNTFTPEEAKQLFNADGTINRNKAMAVWNSYAGGFSKMNSKGEVERTKSWIQEDHLAKLKKTFDASIGTVAQNNKANMDFFVKYTTAKEVNKTVMFNSSEEAKNHYDNQYAILVASLKNGTSSPSDADVKKLIAFYIEKEATIEKYKIAEAVLGAGDNAIYKAKEDGTFGDTLVDKAILTNVVQTSYNNEYRKIMEIQDDNQRILSLKNLIEKEKNSGIKSTAMLSTISSLQTFKGKSVAQITSSIQQLEQINKAGYGWSKEQNGLNEKLIRELSDTALTIKSLGLDEEAGIKAFNDTVLKYNAESRTNYAYLDSNAGVVFKALKDDDFRQSVLTGLGEGLVITSMGSPNVIGGGQKISEIIAKEITAKGQQLDSSASYDASQNKAILAKHMAQRLYITDTKIFGTSLVMLPDVIDRTSGTNAKRPIDGEKFIDGVRGLVKQDAERRKNGDKDIKLDVNFEKTLQFDYVFSESDGVRVKVFANFNGSPKVVGVFTGNDVENGYKWIESKKDLSVKNLKHKVDYTSFMQSRL